MKTCRLVIPCHTLFISFHYMYSWVTWQFIPYATFHFEHDKRHILKNFNRIWFLVFFDPEPKFITLRYKIAAKKVLEMTVACLYFLKKRTIKWMGFVIKNFIFPIQQPSTLLSNAWHCFSFSLHCDRIHCGVWMDVGRCLWRTDLLFVKFLCLLFVKFLNRQNFFSAS